MSMPTTGTPFENLTLRAKPHIECQRSSSWEQWQHMFRWVASQVARVGQLRQCISSVESLTISEGPRLILPVHPRSTPQDGSLKLFFPSAARTHMCLFALDRVGSAKSAEEEPDPDRPCCPARCGRRPSPGWYEHFAELPAQLFFLG